jgi:LDH2 family malate/lactate/ureidoglycolate dehydrogenase
MENQMDRNNTVRTKAELFGLAVDTLLAVGADRAEAELVADSLISADAKGIHSHGLLRLPLYVESVEAGGIVPQAKLSWERTEGATALLDAGSGFGQKAMAEAIRVGAETARRFGTAVIAVKNSTHYGAGAYWTDQIAEDGQIAILVSTTGATVAPYGSAEQFIGTNPLSISYPTGGRPVTADLATSAGAYGKIVEAAGSGEAIPEGWAVDSDGKPTTDAARAVDGGALVAFGGHKGSAIAVLVELLAGAGGGGNFAHDTVDIWADRSSKIGTGNLLIVIDPRVLHGSDEPINRGATFRDDLRGLRPGRGFQSVLAPGDPEAARAAQNVESVGIPSHVSDAIDATARRVGARA